MDKEFVGRAEAEHHLDLADDESRATSGVQTEPSLPGSHPQPDGHSLGDDQKSLAVDRGWAAEADELGLLQPSTPQSRKAGVTRAKVELKPVICARGSQHSADGGETEAVADVKSSDDVPRSRKSGRKAGASETTSRVTPEEHMPCSPILRRSRKRVGASIPGLCDIGARMTHAGDAHHSSSRLAPGAGSATDVVTSMVELPDPQIPEIGEGADARQATVDVIPVGGLPAAQTLSADGGCRIDRGGSANRWSVVDPALISEIRVQWRMLILWTSAEIKLTLQAKAFCRSLATDGDKKEADVIYNAALGKGEHPRSFTAMAAMMPLLEARAGIIEKIERIQFGMVRDPQTGKKKKVGDQDLESLAKKLPVARFIKETRGASFFALAKVIGEAGDLSNYANPGKLWKRMGLAPHVGKAYSTWRKEGGLTAQDWTDAGYKPRRRSAMFVIGGSLIGGMGRGKRPLVGQDLDETDWSPLERLFVERLRYEAARDPENMGRPATAEGKESYSKWAQLRAQRYVEKRFLRLLWAEWRRQAIVGLQSGSDVPAANFLEAAE